MKLAAVSVAFALGLSGLALSAQETPARGEIIIELPKFVVTDSRELPQPEKWRYGDRKSTRLNSSHQ